MFGTIIADPPWDYEKTTKNSRDVGRNRRGTDGEEYYMSGYSDAEYEPLTTNDLCSLSVAEHARDDSVLLLWTTMALIPDALRVVESWKFKYVTSLAWVKIQENLDGQIFETTDYTPAYGVGYWFRGAAELIMVGRRGKAYRTNYVGLLGQRFKHSRKPDDLYLLAEDAFPGPYLELFARRPRDGWTQLGNELPGHEGEDIRDGLVRLKASVEISHEKSLVDAKMERPEHPKTLGSSQLIQANHEVYS